MSYNVNLACGQFTLKVKRSDLALEELLGFASRSNPKRGFLFVSKVLGKHIPCTPSKMREIYNILAQKVGVSSLPTLVFGMAETAIGLGAGVADSLALYNGQKRGQTIFHQSTRHQIADPLFLTFDEIHSHAPDQLVYSPHSDLYKDYVKCKRIVLVDDEITSGRTLTELARHLLAKLHQINEDNLVEELVYVSIVSWLSDEQKQYLCDLLPVRLRFEEILEGTFEFIAHPDFKPNLPGQVKAHAAPLGPRKDLGRQSLDMMFRQQNISLIEKSLNELILDERQAISVIGMGEFSYQAFLLAEILEKRGFQVKYHSTTRSPILLGGAIQNSLQFEDEHGEGVTNYLHNPPTIDQQIILAFESELCKKQSKLKEVLELHFVDQNSIQTWSHP